MNSLASVYWHLAYIVSRLSSELEILYRCIDPGFLKRYIMGVRGATTIKSSNKGSLGSKQETWPVSLYHGRASGEATGLVTEGAGALEARMRGSSPGRGPLTTSALHPCLLL